MKNLSPRVHFIYLTIIFFVFFTLCAAGCSAERESRVSLSFENTMYQLNALTSSSVEGVITEQSKSPYLYYAFPEDFFSAEQSEYDGFVPALSLTFSFQKADAGITAAPADADVFAASLLYDEDFSSRNTLNKVLSPRNSARADVKSLSLKYDGMRIVYALPAGSLVKVRGFMIYSRVPVSLVHAQITDAFLGWHAENKYIIAGVGPDGGDILSPDFSTSDFLSKAGSPFSGSQPPVTVLLRDDPSDFVSRQQTTGAAASSSSAAVQNRVILEFECDKTEKITVRRAPGQKKVTIYPILFNGPVTSVKPVQNGHMVTGIVMNSSHGILQRMSVSALEPGEKRYIPLPADPGIILDWPSSHWRSADFEVFSWEQFPSILIFDTADYAIQDDFFKRLAFFVEKKGYTGRLASDSDIKDEHGFNAHDYRAESLASFFNLAEKENFPLNEKELLLKKILISQNIIQRTQKGIEPGSGAVISLSKESPSYLRTTFIVHESFHGLYFTDDDFRAYNSQVYSETDYASLMFLHKYFEVTPSLNYDTNDTYLMQNEFMAYLLQQPVYAVGPYFTDRLASRRYINEKHPETARYIKETKAAAFTDAAKKLDAYVFSRWGVAAGRVWLVTRQ